MTKSMWTPSRRTSHSKIMGINSPPFTAITASTLLGRLSTRCWNIATVTCFHLATSISEVRHWCWPITPGSQSVFQFIPKVFSGVEVMALYRLVKFFHTDFHTPFLYGPRIVHSHIVILVQKMAFSNLLPQNWEHRIVWNVIVCSSVKISFPLYWGT